MPSSPLTVLFMPESAYGPTNQCIGIGKVLLELGHRVVFAAEASWQGKLAALGFEEDLVDLAPAVEAMPGEPEDLAVAFLGVQLFGLRAVSGVDGHGRQHRVKGRSAQARRQTPKTAPSGASDATGERRARGAGYASGKGAVSGRSATRAPHRRRSPPRAGGSGLPPPGPAGLPGRLSRRR